MDLDYATRRVESFRSDGSRCSSTPNLKADLAITVARDLYKAPEIDKVKIYDERTGQCCDTIGVHDKQSTQG